jgi:hypothetical protein
VFGPAADTTAEIADRNPSGVSGAITGFVTLQPSFRDLKGVSPLPPRLLDKEGHKWVRPTLLLRWLGRTIVPL